MPCPGPLHFSHIAYYMYDICPLPVTDVGLSTIVCNVEHTYFHLVCVAASLFCVYLVNVQVSAPYVIASTRELYTCFGRHMTRLLLKRFRCLAPAMILRCISLSWLFSLRLDCCSSHTYPSSFSISTLFTFIWGALYDHHLVFAFFILRPIHLLSLDSYCRICRIDCVVSVHKNVSSENRRLVRTSLSISTALFIQNNFRSLP